MAFRQNVGIAGALALGMALGYAVSPLAQGAVAPAVSELKFRIEPSTQDRVKVTLTSGPFAGRFLQSASLDGSLTSDTLFFTAQPAVNGVVQFLPLDVPKR
jgi:hypothetical protein